MVTTSYTNIHRAFVETAREWGLTPFDVRVLVALCERFGVARTDELEADLQGDGSAIRRAIGTLRTNRLIEADAGEGTTRTRRGVRARLTLTDDGEAIALAALEEASR